MYCDLLDSTWPQPGCGFVNKTIPKMGVVRKLDFNKLESIKSIFFIQNLC
jgi:hypothetical protein